MADHDENEDDLFADLYDGEDSGLGPTPTVATAAPSQPIASEPTSIPQAEHVQEPIANGSDPAAYGNVGQDDSGAYGDGQAYDQGQGENNVMQDVQSWDNNQSGYNQGDDEDQGVENYDRPIGIKEDGKMFIGGLNWETTDQSLKDYFSQFGEVVECTVMRDNASGRSRGFGFLTFRNPKDVNIVMVKEHQLDGKIIDPKRAIPRDEQERTSKIFVGGVSQEASEQDFKQFFMQFGRVLDATLMMDKDTGRPRGFGFVTFDSEAAVDRTLQGPLEILGKPIEVKKAQPRGNLREDNEDGGGRGGRFRQKNDRFNQNGGNQGFGGAQQNDGSAMGAAAAGGPNGMSPAMMAQYWAKMQSYFQMMQQQMAAGMAGRQGMNPMMGGQGNPMMQQMMAMQGQMGGQGMPNGMNPQAMMQQMQQMQQMQGGGGGGGYPGQQQNNGGMMSPMDGNGAGGGSAGPAANRPAYNAQEQLMFEQQKYERQQQSRMGGGGPGGFQSAGSPTSWEGMYDDVPAPGGMGGGGGGSQNGGNNNGGGGFRGGGRGGRGGRMGSQGPSGMPAGQAPVNAPTGPRNAGKPGANYRGGGSRGAHRGFHPYQRGN